jgi:hypothetical protein
MRALAGLAAALLATACRPPPSPSPSPPPVTAPTAAAVTDPAPTPGAATAWELPGRFGELTTRMELEARFGATQVRAETVPGAEGIGTVPLLVVFPDTPHRRLELVQEADNPDAPVRELRISGMASDWYDVRGVRLGMPLSDLVALNGAPIAYYGLAWDYGGTVQDWNGGRLANAVGHPVFRRVTLGARPGADPDALPVGDGAFRSDDRAWPAAARDLVVVDIGISWPGSGER